MAEEENEINDRQVVEEYLKLYCIEEILDETINSIVERRPTNPYVEIAKLIEAKTMPEIIEVLIKPVLSLSGVCGVEAVVNTNLGTFTGKCSFPFDIDEQSDCHDLKDFEVFELKIDDALKNVDPTALARVDETLLGLADIDPAVVTAVSIAAARAGSRHKGVALHRFLADLAGTEPQIPVPVPAILSRTVGDHQNMQTQQLQLYPVRSVSLENALTTLMKTVSVVNRDIVSTKMALTVSVGGCSQLSDASSDEMCTVVRDAIASSGHAVKMSVDYRGGSLVSLDEGGISYSFNGAPSEDGGDDEGSPGQQSGGEVVESVVLQLKEMEWVSVEDPLHVRDMDSLRQLKDRVAETMAVIREERAEELRYNTVGIGGEEGCALQVVADSACKSAEEIKILADENVFNAVKIRFDKVSTISAAIAMVKAAREIGWSTIASCSEDAPDCADTFLVDFAVGMGCGQLMAGALQGPGGDRYNRLLEISRADSKLDFAGPDFRR